MSMKSSRHRDLASPAGVGNTPRKVVRSTGPSYVDPLAGYATTTPSKKKPAMRKQTSKKTVNVDNAFKTSTVPAEVDENNQNTVNNKIIDPIFTSKTVTKDIDLNVTAANDAANESKQVYSPMFFIPRPRASDANKIVDESKKEFDAVVEAAAAVVTQNANQDKNGDKIRQMVAEALDVMLNANEINNATHRRLSSAACMNSFTAKTIRRLSMTGAGSGSSGDERPSLRPIKKDDVLSALRTYIDALDQTDNTPVSSEEETKSEPASNESNVMRDICEEARSVAVESAAETVDESIMITDTADVTVSPQVVMEEIYEEPAKDDVAMALMPEEGNEVVPLEEPAIAVDIPVEETKMDIVKSRSSMTRVSINRASLSVPVVANDRRSSVGHSYPMQAVLEKALADHRVSVTLKDWVVLQDHVKYQLFIELLPDPSNAHLASDGAQLMLLRRYSDFERLHDTLQGLASNLSAAQQKTLRRLLPSFPGKQIVFRYYCWAMQSFVDGRMAGLQAWVTGVLQVHGQIVALLNGIETKMGDAAPHSESQVDAVTAYEVALKEFLFI